MNKANSGRIRSWDYLCEINPDIALLQEVNSVPEFIVDKFDILYRKAITKAGKPQKFGTAIFVKGKIVELVPLLSEWDWVNKLLERFSGNLVAAKLILDNGFAAHAISVHSPAWDIDSRWFNGTDISELAGLDISALKLENSPKLWATELLWATLRHLFPMSTVPWIVGGDLNSSVTFDFMWPGGPHGNQEVQDRMIELNFTECLLHSQGQLTPTFMNANDKKVIHQIDHLFVPTKMLSELVSCNVGDSDQVFGGVLSDHLPIIADFSV